VEDNAALSESTTPIGPEEIQPTALFACRVRELIGCHVEPESQWGCRVERLALTCTCLIIEHTLGVAGSPSLLVELAPAVATEENGDADQTQNSSQDKTSYTKPVVVKGERILLPLRCENHRGKCHQQPGRLESSHLVVVSPPTLCPNGVRAG